jgi:hypothetical protein
LSGRVPLVRDFLAGLWLGAHNKIRELAKKENVSMNQLINSAITEKLSALMTVEYLQKKKVKFTRKV